MQLIREERYKVIIADEPDAVPRGYSGFYIPVTSNNEYGNVLLDKDLNDPTSYIKYYLDREWPDDCQNSETESETEDEDYDDDDDWSPAPSPLPVPLNYSDEYEEGTIDDDELHEILTVLENIVHINPQLFDDPMPVIGMDIYKYGSFVAESDELVWEYEYCIHEDPTQTYAAG